MKVPKIDIKYVEIYDIVLSKSKKIEYNNKRRFNGERFAKQLQKFWNTYEKKILFSMSKISRLKWQKNNIQCFVSFNTPYSFSHPLTLRIYKNMRHQIVNLTHELCHIILWDNRKKVRFPWLNIRIYKKHKSEKYNTKLHFSIHALVILIMKEVFKENAEKYLKWERWWEYDLKNPLAKEYRRSWEIVEKEGPEEVLKEVIK